MERLEPLIRELGLENRVFILNVLRKEGKSVAQIRKELKMAGVVKPFSTVGRYLKSLKEIHLVCEVEDEYHLTLKGRVVLRWLSALDHKLAGFEKADEILSGYPIDYLPDEFLDGVHTIGLAEIVTDPFNVMWDTIKAVEEAKKEVKVINTDIINREFGELAVKKCVQGVRLTSVIYSSTVDERIKMLYEIIEEQGIGGKDLAILKRNFLARSIGGAAPNLIIADEKGAGISLADPGSKSSLTPAFESDNKGFIDWVEKIFTWHWNKGVDVKW